MMHDFKVQYYLNTQQLEETLTGKNKAFITRVSNQQRTKYGNVDIFDAAVSVEDVEIWFGEKGITFYFRDGKIYDTTGNGQGHRYTANLQACAEELYDKIIIKGE